MTRQRFCTQMTSETQFMQHRILFLALLAATISACHEQTARREGFSVHGIDVSHYQQQVDWQKVAGQGVEFAFIKATEGRTFQDSLFCKNWDAMKNAGIKRGAYHFFRPGTPAADQAQHFIQTIDLAHGDLPPVLDVEVMDGYPDSVLLDGVKEWLRIVEEKYLVKPVLYTNQRFFNQHFAENLHGYPVWIARYSAWRTPNLDEGHSWRFWQYGNRGRLVGIEGDVDFNVFNGSRSDLDQLCFQRPAPLLNRYPAPVQTTPVAPPSPDEAATSEPVAANP